MLPLILLSLIIPMNERLNYGGYYGLLRVGSSYMEISGVEKLKGRPVYIIESSQKTEGIFSFFFHLEDYYISYVDTGSFSTSRFIKKIHEGNYKNEVTLDFERDSVFYSNGKKVDANPEAKDIFASIYYMRNITFSPGDTISIPFHSSGKNYDMIVPVSGPYWITVPAGKHETYLLSPVVPKGKIFRSSEPLKIWVSTDSLHVPLKIESHLSFGTISFMLESIEIGGRRK
ncbi:DUF3108 domain-containing protein [candidate division WOR-3 bacterium]|nr:DUF3108 domain-containing protein [candidate division WOR-3 bacterium]